MKLTNRESSLQKGAIALLTLHGFPTYRINAGSIQTKGGGWVRLAPTGFSDLLVLAPGGRWMSVEVKRPGCRDRLTDAQRAFLETVQRAGGVALVVDDLDVLDRVIERLKADPQASFTLHGDPR